MSGGDFLSRWSKRKRAVAQPPPADDVAAGQTAAPEAVAALAEGDEAGLLPPEELAKLPSLDSLTAETDLTQFLRAGVPTLMRKAALRRMWSVDTNIRDYVSEAREYAYDWNAIGGVPGNGPMLPTDDIKAMLRDIFDGTPVAEVEPDPSPAEPETSARAEAVPVLRVSDDDAAGAEPEPPVEPEPVPAIASISDGQPVPEPGSVARPRRHGGAVPL